MPELLTLNNIGSKGLSSDSQPWTLPPEFITYGNNFRIFSGSITTKGGVALWSTAPGAVWYPGHPVHVGGTSSNFWIIAGRDLVYLFDGTTWTDISSAIGYITLGTDDELLWTSCLLGRIPIINSPQTGPEYWSPQLITQIMQPLLFEPGISWASKGFTFNVIRSHKNFLFALNLTEGGIEYKDTYRWSHPADINGLPATWDETDPSFLAGRSSLGGDGGNIVDGRSLRDSFAMYSENSIDILDYTNDEFVWRRRSLSSTIGVLSKNSIVEVKGAHFILADGDIVKNDGTSIESIIHNRIRGEFSSRISIDNYDRSYAVRNDSQKEVWFCIPEQGASYPNIAYIYNWRDDSWSVKDIPDGIGFSNYGSQSVAADDWDSHAATDLWDDQNQIWNSSGITPIQDTVIGADPINNKLYFIDPVVSDTDVTTVIERTNFPLIDDRQVTTITRVYPHVDGQRPITIEFGSHDYPGSPIRWKPAIIFNPLTDRKIDIRTTGELHAWRYTQVAKSETSLSGMSIEFERAGLR